MATHSPLSANAWIAITKKAVYRLVIFTPPLAVGMVTGLIFLYGGLRITRSNLSSSNTSNTDLAMTSTSSQTCRIETSDALARSVSCSMAVTPLPAGACAATIAARIPVPEPRSRIRTGSTAGVNSPAACSATGAGVRNCSHCCFRSGERAAAASLRICAMDLLISTRLIRVLSYAHCAWERLAIALLSAYATSSSFLWETRSYTQ